MPITPPSRRRLRSLCAEVHADDGSDPRLFFRKDGSRGKPRHKARQLCRQVLEVLDSLLDDLAVVSVDPAPDAATLLVTVAGRPAILPVSPSTILERLDRASGWLRSEVASAITRKRAPLLVYRVVEFRNGIEPAAE
ncbi:ribosome-binding factor A [Tundrisphaera lichenicola]|uniref:ribosome-binding factor A n=1 Tax=Tundrisphaera lichenicola TaxID=2029860 RepID=UPI003EBA1B26